MTCDVRLGRILGLPAICGARVVGHVERAVPDQEGHHLQGLVIRRGLGSARWAERSRIAVLGDVSVILREKPCRMPRCSSVTLGPVKDESGLALGRVTDLWIRPDTFDITALEITLGLIEDLRHGRRKIRQWTLQPGEEEAMLLIPRAEWEGGETDG